MAARKAKTMRDDTALKAAILEAALSHVAPDGFTDAVLVRAGEGVGADKAAIARLFPGGPLSLIEAFSDDADRKMAAALAKKKLSTMKIRERIKSAVLARLDALRPHKEVARRAAAFLTLPPHAPLGLKLLYRTVDAMWRDVGDTSTDFNFYTKRALLAGVWSATLLRWFNDESENETATQEFLDRRIEDVIRFEKFKAEVKERAAKLPSLGDILSRVSPRRS